MRTDDLRIAKTHPLLSPAVLAEEFPLRDRAAACVATQRTTIERILSGEDRRLLAVVGPCSIHDVDAAREYAARLRPLVDEFADRLLVVMRVYFEKPRTILGWKGLINDPDLDNSYRINRGLRLARQLMCDIAELELGAATEFLDTTLGQFYADLVCWAAIGARTVESQIHRELASGLSMPVGFKNRTDGNVQVAVEAIISAQNRHLFPSLTAHGAPAIFETTGNPWGHLVLRGGKQSGPNFAAAQVEAAASQLAAAGIKTGIMVDCSHGNSQKDPTRQLEVADCIAEQLRAGSRAIRAVMVESHLVAGAQPIGAASSLVYGQSITDACLGFDDTRRLLASLAAAVGE